MVDILLQIGFLIRHFPEGICLGEALLAPEILSMGSTAEAAAGGVRSLLPALLAEEGMRSVSQRQGIGEAGELSVESLTLKIERPADGMFWREPIELVFHAVRWARMEGGVLGYVPGLRVGAIAEDAADLMGRLEREARFALQRRRVARSLAEMVELQRAEQLEVRHDEMMVSLKSAKQLAQEELKGEAEQKSVLEEVATDLTKRVMAAAIGMEEVVARVADALVGRSARSVLLVGASGVGKTAAVNEMVRRRGELGMGDRGIWETSGSRLLAGALGFGVWQERCHKLCREAAGKGAILYLGNLVELLEVGKSESNGMSIAGFMRGYMARGELLAIAECTPEQVAVLEREDPHLLAAFRQVKMEEPMREVGRRILRHAAEERRGGNSRRISEEGLDRVERLHRRFATYSGFPGRPIRFVRNLLRDIGPEEVGAGEVTAAFSRETGLPLFMLDDAVRLDVEAARAWLSGQVIAQEEAAELVADLLAALKAGLNRPRRPIASLLFIGPTGVGKTEMAKAITEYFFKDRARLTRFDMSEFNTAEAVERLAGGFGRTEGMLTAKIRQQPFSVVLFDEVEKAHRGFFDLMLQVLGEGRLTDAGGRLADFSNCIIIMTSNLGAASFGRPGFGLREGRGGDAAEHFTEEVRAFLRPELFNRIDRIVPFLPLDAAAIGKIAIKELNLVRGRDGLRLREVAFDVDESSALYLARKGFDAAYGARPLKRAMERELLVPLADALNGYAENLPLTAVVRAGAGGLTVRVRATGEVSVAQGIGPLVAKRAALLRRQMQRLEKHAVLLDVQNEVFRLERQIKREEIKRPNHPMLPAWYQRLKRLRGPLDEAVDLSAKAIAVEESVLLDFYEGKGEKGEERDWAKLLTEGERRLGALLLELHGLRFENPHVATVAIFGEQAGDMFVLAKTYWEAARGREARVSLGWYAHDSRGLLLHREEDAGEYVRERKGKPIGIVMEVEGAFVLPLFEGEKGSHVFKRGKLEPACLVEVRAGAMSGFQPPAEVHRLGGVLHTSVRRQIDLDAKTVTDPRLEDVTQWTRLEAALLEMMERWLTKVIREPIEA